MLASSSADTTIKLWDVASGRNVRTLRGHADKVNSVAFSPNGYILASGSHDCTIKLWDVNSGSELRTLVNGHGVDWVSSVAFSPDGRTLVSGGFDMAVKLWDVGNGSMRLSFAGVGSWVYCVAFSPDGRTVASGGYDADGSIKLWDVANAHRLSSLTEGTRGITHLAFSGDGRILASGSSQMVKLWDMKTRRELLTVSNSPIENDLSPTTRGAHLNIGFSVAFSPDGRILAAGGTDKVVIICDVSNGRKIRTLGGHTNPVSYAAFNADGRILASGSRSSVTVWDVKAGRLLRTLTRSHTEYEEVEMCGAFALSANASTVAAGGYNGTITIWDVASGRELRTIKGSGYYSFEGCSAAFSPDGSIVALGGSHGTVQLWDVAAGREVGTLGNESTTMEFISSLAFSPDGHTLASGSSEKIVNLWDLDARIKLQTFEGHTDRVEAVAFSPDGRTIASSSRDKTIKLWDVGTGRELRTLMGHSKSVRSLGFSPDGHLLGSGSDDNTVKLWDVTTGNEIRTLNGHTNSVTSVAFRVDGRTLVSGSGATTKLWDFTSGRELASLFDLSQGHWVVSDPEGRFDTNDLDEIQGLSWIFPDDPFRPLAPETFMRDYYEPRLLQRLLAGDPLPQVRPLQDLNRVQPQIKIVSVRRGKSPELAEVTVEVSPAQAQFQRGTEVLTMKTDVYDIRLFRSGHVVAQEPETKVDVDEILSHTGEMSAKQLQTWRDTRRVKLDTTGRAKKTFMVSLPYALAGKQVEFTAYAFNEDRVRSEIAKATYTVPMDMSVHKAKAYVITIGINGYENPHRNLEFAVKDAEDMAVALRQIKNYEVVPVSLLSEAANDRVAAPASQATKAKIRAVLGVLGGHRPDRADLIGIPNADQLERATPDDLVILTFSGHGDTETGGMFYLLPSDSGTDKAITPSLLKRFISSEELSEWLREVDAGQMAMIIDACHSAASVDPGGFKPGPMGDRGLGQLAYDKGMRILAASQADNVALEIQNLHQGLLTYALVWEGLRSGDKGNLKADLNGDGTVTLEEWLKYAEQRTPSLYDDAKAGKVKMVSRDSVINPAFIDETTQRAQTPALFDFHKQNDSVVLNWR